MNKSSGAFRASSSSQASQDESSVCDFVKSDGGENEIINNAGNTPDIKEKHNNNNTNNIAKYRGERLEGKFVSGNVINLSRRNISYFFLSGFSFTNIYESQDFRGRGRAFL